MKTKFLCLFIALIFASASQAQIYDGYATYMFQMNQPNARSEALGWGNAVLTGSPFMSIYNPASSSFTKGITAEISHLKFNFPTEFQADYSSYGVSANLGRYGSVALNYQLFSWNVPFYITTPDNPATMEKYEPTTGNFLLNYSYMILDNISAGININYFDDSFARTSITGWMLDAGILKKFNLNSGGAPRDLYLGLSVSNITNSKLELNEAQYEYYPSILRLAAGFEYEHEAQISGYCIFKSLFMPEYYDMLNSGFYSRFQFSAEITLLEMLKLRGGWFTEGRNNYGSKENISTLEKFTYGFGVELPFRRIIGKSLPLNIKVDHANLQFPKYSTRLRSTENCPVYSVSATYEL